MSGLLFPAPLRLGERGVQRQPWLLRPIICSPKRKFSERCIFPGFPLKLAMLSCSVLFFFFECFSLFFFFIIVPSAMAQVTDSTPATQEIAYCEIAAVAGTRANSWPERWDAPFRSRASRSTVSRFTARVAASGLAREPHPVRCRRAFLSSLLSLR